MKRILPFVALAACAVGLGARAETVWTVNDARTQISDGTWTLNVAGYPKLRVRSVASGNAAKLDLNDNYVDSANNPLADVHIYDIGGTFNGKSSLTNVTINLPELRRLGRGCGTGTFQQTTLKTVKINAPKCEILGYQLFNGCTLTCTSFDDWILPNLRRIEPRVFCADNNTNVNGPTGTLRLPLLDDADAILGSGTATGFGILGSSSIILGDATLPSAYREIPKSFFRGGAVTNVELLSRSLTTLRGTCFQNCKQLKTMTLGGTDFTNANSDTPLASVSLDALTILGHVLPSTPLGAFASATKTYGIWNVSTNQGWKSLSGLVTDLATIQKNHASAYAALTDAQKADLIGIFNQSSRNIWLIHTDSPYDADPAYRLDAHVADQGFEEISVSPAGSSVGVYAPGTVVTLVAPEPTLAGTSFACWTGDVPAGADVSNRTLVVTMDQPRVLRAHYTRKWVYDATAKTLENGLWSFSVTEDANGGLTFAGAIYGEGNVSLTDDIVTPEGEAAGVYLCSVPQLPNDKGLFNYRRVPTVSFVADNIPSVGGNICRDAICTNFVFVSRALTTLGKCPFYDNPVSVSTLTYGGEQITTVSSDYPFKNVSAKSVTIYGGTLTGSPLSYFVGATQSYATWRVSRRMGWGVMSGLETDLETILATAAHQTAYNKLSAADQANLIGLYTSGSKYIWFINTKSPYEKEEEVDLLVRAVRTDLDTELLVGTVTPEYGQTTEDPKTEIEFSIEEYAASEEVLYRAIGSVTATQGADLAWYDTGTNYVRSFTYTVPSVASRITWLLKPCGHRLIATPTDSGLETMTTSETAILGNYYTNGTVFVLTAGDPQHARSSFTRWVGDLPDGSDPTAKAITVTMDQARTIQAEYLRGGWVYDATKKQLGDGNWCFSTTVASDGGLSVGNYQRGTGAIRMTDDIQTTEGVSGQYYLKELLRGDRVVDQVDPGLFAGLSGLTDFYLKAEHVPTITKNFVRCCSSLRSFVFDSAALTNLERCIFYDSPNIKNVTLGGRQIESFARDGITGSLPNGMRQLAILGAPLSDDDRNYAADFTLDYAVWYVPRRMGWTVSAIPNTLTREQILANATYRAQFAKLSADDQRHLIGLYVRASDKHIWLINRHSPYLAVPGAALWLK